MSLTQFQDQFAQALFNAEVAPEIAPLACQPGFAVYHNTVMKGCIDALQANYPSVTRLAGEEWFRAAAAVYVAEHKPHDVRLLYYGDTFPDFLAGFAPAAELPYLSRVARLDRCWTEAHAAPDAAPLVPTMLAGLAPESLATCILLPHPATRWAWFADQPIYTIWQRNRVPTDDESEIEWRGEGALLARSHGTVTWGPLGAGGCVFLDACNAGHTLAEAANAALDAQEDTDVSRLLADLLEFGAFRFTNETVTTEQP
jgi:hypothetical protein